MTRTFDSVSAHLLANIPESLGLSDTNTSVASTTALFCDRANVGENPMQKATERLIREEWMRRGV